MLEENLVKESDVDLSPLRQAAANARDVDALVALPDSEVLREPLILSPDNRVLVLSLVPAQLAAQLIEEAPSELAAGLVERQTADSAAEIFDELVSDVQPDLIGDLDENTPRQFGQRCARKTPQMCAASQPALMTRLAA